MPPKKAPVTKAPVRAPVKATPAKGAPAKVPPGKKGPAAPTTGKSSCIVKSRPWPKTVLSQNISKITATIL